MEDSESSVRRLFEKLLAAFIFVLVLALYPDTGNPTGDIKELLTAWGACLITCGWFFAAWWNKIPLRKPVALSFPIAGLIALYLVASCFSSYRMLGLIETARLVSLAGFYFVASQVYTTPDAVRRLLKTLVAAAVAASLYGFLQAAGLDPVPWDAGDKKSDLYTGLPASYGNPNFAAHVMVLTLPIALYLLWVERSWPWAAAAVIMLVHFRMTGQRAGYIGLAGAAALFSVATFVVRAKFRPLLAPLLSIALWGLLGIIGVLAGMGLLSWFTGSPLPLDTSLHIRYWSYVSATSMVKDAPLLGHGPGVYRHTYHDYWTQLEKEWYVQENRKNEHVHNDLMEIAIDAGLPSAGLYLMLLLLGIGYGIAWAVRAGPKERLLGLVFAALFAGFLLDGLFGFNFRVPVSAGYVMLLLGALEGLVSVSGAPLPDRRWSLSATGASLALCAVAILATGIFAAQYRLFLGERALNANQLDAAEVNLKLGEALSPWDARFALQRSKISYVRNDIDAAITELHRMFSIDPHYFPSKLTMARYELLRAQRALAAKPNDITEAVDHLDKSSAAAREFLAVCGEHPLGEKVLGRAAAATALALTTSDKQRGASRAKPYWEEAEKHFEAGTKTAAAEQDDIYRLLAQTKLALGKPAEAETAYERAAKSDPTDPATWGQFLAFANGNRRYERIRNTLVAVIGTLTAETEPRKDVLSLVRLCLANVQENGYNDFDRAEREYRDAAALTPLSPELWSNFARFAFQRGRADALKEALRTAQEQLVKEKADIPAQLRVVFAALREKADALEEASAVLVAQVRSYPADAKLTAQQTYEWTAHLLRERLEALPAEEQGTARFNVGIVYLQFKDYETADKLFASANGRLPEDLVPKHAAMWSEVMLHFSRGQEAINMLAPLREKHGDDFDLRHAYARALAAVGQLPEAKAEYEKLLAEPDLGTDGRAALEQEANAIR